MTLYRGTPILWTRDKHAEHIGRGRHGIIWVGTIYAAVYAGKATGEWEWGMVVTGFGRDPARIRGFSPSKEAAKADCEACYIALMEIAGNYEAAAARYRQLEERTRLFEERRVQFGPVDESRGW